MAANISSGAGSFPNGAMPSYSTPVYPPASGPTFQAYPLPGANYSSPAPGAAAAGGIRVNQQHRGSWVSEVPVTSNVTVLKSAYSKYLEARDLAFCATGLRRAGPSDQRSAVFNLYTINHWVREHQAEARAELAALKNSANATVRAAAAGNEWMLDELIASVLDGDAGPTLGISAKAATALCYLTTAGIQRQLCYLGPVISQPNMMTSAHIANGSMSADGGQTQMACVWRGPVSVFNVWGAQATEGRFLWLQLKPVDIGDGVRVLQFVPYVAAGHSAEIAPGANFYVGPNGHDEKPWNVLIGRMVERGRRTERDGIQLHTAAGLIAPGRAQMAPPDLAQSHDACQQLETVKVAVNPKQWGSFVCFA